MLAYEIFLLLLIISLNGEEYMYSLYKEGFLLAQKGISTNFNNLFLDNDIIKPKYNKENFYEINIRYSF